MLYLPVTLYAGNFPVENVLGELVRDAVLDGTFYHLWYLPAALLGVLVVCGLLRFLRPGAAAGVCGARLVSGGAFGRQLVWPCKTAARAERGL